MPNIKTYTKYRANIMPYRGIARHQTGTISAYFYDTKHISTKV